MTDPNNAQAPQDDNLLDHNYDGIQEYDNPLPGWWVAIFWGTIVWSFLYFGWYTAGPGDGVYDNLDQKLEALADQKEKATAEKLSSVGEVSGSAASLIAMMNNEELMKSQEAVWAANNCATCHVADGRGLTGLGPNMTDDTYVNIKKIEDIPGIIADGVPGKAMTAYRNQLSEQEIWMLSAYVASLRGKALDPANDAFAAKEAEGEVILPWSAD